MAENKIFQQIITTANAGLLGLLYYMRETNVSVADYPFTFALEITANMFVTICCSEVTQVFAGFHIVNASVLIANVNIFHQLMHR